MAIAGTAQKETLRNRIEKLESYNTLDGTHSHIRAKKTLLPRCWQYKPSENIETLWQVNLPENRLFESSVSSQEVQLDIDGQGVRWRRSRPAAENTLPLLLSTIYINNIRARD